MQKFSLIVAMDKNRGIGKDGGLPWHLTSDLKHFKQITLSAAEGKVNAVVMGRKTWESLPNLYRPLPGRLNIILTRNKEINVPAGCFRCADLDSALEMLSQRCDIDRVFVIGGASVYQQSIDLPGCECVYVTEIDGVFECDVFFPEIPPRFQCVAVSERFDEKNIGFSFVTYQAV